MSKPTTTPLRRAVDFLIEEGIILNDKDLLPLFKLESPGALSAYISGTPSKKGLKAFKEKYGDKVSKFFENNDEEGNLKDSGIPVREYINELKGDKAMYMEIIKTNLASINMSLAKLVEIQEKISLPEHQGESEETPVFQGANTFQVLPFGGKSGAPNPPGGQGKSPAKGKSNKGKALKS